MGTRPFAGCSCAQRDFASLLPEQLFRVCENRNYGRGYRCLFPIAGLLLVLLLVQSMYISICFPQIRMSVTALPRKVLTEEGVTSAELQKVRISPWQLHEGRNYREG